MSELIGTFRILTCRFSLVRDECTHRLIRASLPQPFQFGFRHAGLLPNVGWKQGRWLDSVLMVRALGPGAEEPPPPGR